MNSMLRIPSSKDAAATTQPRILMFLGDTIDRRRRSGIHRVAVETARALSSLTTLDLVRWDFGEGRLRFLDAYELDIVFGKGAWPAGIKARRCTVQRDQQRAFMPAFSSMARSRCALRRHFSTSSCMPW